MATINNNDTGSLHIGLALGTREWKVGDTIQIKGESKVRTVTYVMGKGEKTHLCFKGQGPLKEGEVEVTLVAEAITKAA